jgi:hypothetical protein
LVIHPDHPSGLELLSCSLRERIYTKCSERRLIGRAGNFWEHLIGWYYGIPSKMRVIHMAITRSSESVQSACALNTLYFPNAFNVLKIELCLVGCGAMYCGRNLQTFRRNILLPSSGLKRRPCKQPAG